VHIILIQWIKIVDTDFFGSSKKIIKSSAVLECVLAP